jgi:acetyl esterase/lipase
MNLLFIALSALTFLFALVQFNTFESLLLWKLSILTTEYGQWLAILSSLFFLARVFTLTRLERSGRHIVEAALLAVATGLFLYPSAQFLTHFPAWEFQLNSNFGNLKDAQSFRPSVSRLWLGPLQDSKIEPRKIVYWSNDDSTLSLDFYSTHKSASAPWVLVIHGGGWNSGTPEELADLNSYLALRGYAVAVIEYRLAPKDRWPAPRIDALHAVDFLKSHSSELGINPDKWVVLGRSAGGQIAESVAFQSPPSGLKGCIAFYAPSDLTFAYKYSREDDILSSRELMREYLGGEPQNLAGLYRDSSPLEFVSSHTSPTLMFHGPRDPLVWIRHSERLNAKLNELGVPNVFIEIPWATHGFDFNLSGPGGQVSTFAIEYFLKKVFS